MHVSPCITDHWTLPTFANPPAPSSATVQATPTRTSSTPSESYRNHPSHASQPRSASGFLFPLTHLTRLNGVPSGLQASSALRPQCRRSLTMASTDEGVGVEPINFRAALAAFEGKPASTSSGQMPAPAPRHVSSRKPWSSQTEDESQEPIQRSNSQPRIRHELINNPFAQKDAATSPPGPPARSKPIWPLLDVPDDSKNRLRKSGSGTSLHELMQRSIPDQSANRSRSKSLAGRDSSTSSGQNSPGTYSGRNSPRLGVKNIIALYGNSDTLSAASPSSPYGALRTSSPMSFASANSTHTTQSFSRSDKERSVDYLDDLEQPAKSRPSSANGLLSAPDDLFGTPSRKGSTGSNFSSATVPATSVQNRPPPFLRTSSYTAGTDPAPRTEVPPKLPTRNALQATAPSRSGSHLSRSPRAPPSLPARSGTGPTLPRLPPRPPSSGTAASSVSEFGQLSEASSPSALKKISPQPSSSSSSNSATSPRPPIAYATYTPGSKRNGSHDASKAPPALPPRSATLGQASNNSASRSEGLLHPTRTDETGNNSAFSYALRQRSPARPDATPTSATTSAPIIKKPNPPPRPNLLQSSQGPGTTAAAPVALDGNAGGFRFGGTRTTSTATNTPSQPPPVPRTRPTGYSNHRGKLGTIGSDPSPSIPGSVAEKKGHAKNPSNVFTSISLSDDASHELRQSLESDMFRSPEFDGHQSNGSAITQPPPSRSRTMHKANRSVGSMSAASASSSPSIGQLSTGKVLWETASSALPLPFRNNAPGNAGRALAEGAPSKQMQYQQARGVSPFGSDPALMIRPGDFDGSGLKSSWSGQPQTRAVLLAEPVVAEKVPRSTEPASAGARRRYESLFDDLLKSQRAVVVRQASKEDEQAKLVGSVRGKQRSATRPNLDALLLADGSKGTGSDSQERSDDASREAGPGGVRALRGWFEPGSVGQQELEADDTGAKKTVAERSSPDILSVSRIRKVWKRSKLPDPLLAEVWEAAMSQQKTKQTKGLEKEAFVRAMAAIDAELSMRSSRRRARTARLTASSGHDRRGPAQARSLGIQSRTTGSTSPLMREAGLNGQRRVSDGSTSSNASTTTSTHSGTRRMPPPPPRTAN